MSGYHQRIQGADRLLRIRRIRKAVYAALVALAAVLMYARALSEGASLKPFFLPLDGVLEIGLMMGLVGTILGIYLKNLEIKGAALDSQRYLLSKYSMSRALTTALAALVLGVILLLPATEAGLSSAATEPPQYLSIPPNSSVIVSLTSPDAFGVTYAKSVYVQVVIGPISVLVQCDGRAVISGAVRVAGSLDLPFDPNACTTPGNWSVVFRNTGGTGATAVMSYTFPLGVMPSLFSTVPLLLFLVAASNLGWWFGLRPIRARTKAEALYAGKDTATEIGMGERAYLEYAMQPAPVAYPAQVATDPLPPPPPANPLPPPPAPDRAPVATPARVPGPQTELRPGPRPDTAEAYAVKGDTMMAGLQYAPAVAAYDEALLRDPNSVPVLNSKARALFAIGQGPAALDVYHRVLTIDPANAEALRGTANILVSEKRWREVLEVAETILRRRPNDVWALELKGDVLTSLGRRAEALAAYDAAHALDPENGNLAQKIEEVRVDVPGLLSRALIASASGNYLQALNHFDDILEVDPSNVNALIGKAVAYRRSGKPNEALNCLDLVLNFQPANASALLNRGTLLLETGDLGGALEAYAKLLSLSPEDEEAWVAQGDVFLMMGRGEEAMHSYKEALRLNPGDEEVQHRIQELESTTSPQPEVLQELFKVRGVGPARAKALFEAGFHTAEDFQKTTVDQLLAVKGITRRIAEDLVQHFKVVIVAVP